MKGSLEAPPIVLRGARWRGFLFLAFALLFTLEWMPVASAGRGAGGAGAFLLIVAALFGGLGLWMIARPARLILSPDGVEQTVLWRRRVYGWEDICNFRLTSVGIYGQKVVGFDFVDETRARGMMRQFNSAITGVDGVFQRGWEIKPPALALLLTDARNRWLAGEAPLPAATGEEVDGGPAPASQTTLGIAGGRMSPKVYWIITAVLALIGLGPSLLSSHAFSTGAAPTVIWIWVFGRRLHDIGRSAWWQLAIYAVRIVVLSGLMATGMQATEAFAFGYLAQILCAVGLGFVPGDPKANRFGQPPGVRAPATVAETFR